MSWMLGLDAQQLTWWQMGWRAAMKTSHISQQDLESALRLKAKLRDLEQVDVARLESSGEISVLTKEKPPRVFEVKVEDGVKTVRIEFD
ncbi:MAG: YetF domain-containing protein [Geitlerinemataceae cyanobacterium]